MIVWTARALQDIQEAVLHISESSERAADKVGGAILAAGESLTYFPKRGRYGKQNGTRELIVQSTPTISSIASRAAAISSFAGSCTWRGIGLGGADPP